MQMHLCHLCIYDMNMYIFIYVHICCPVHMNNNECRSCVYMIKAATVCETHMLLCDKSLHVASQATNRLDGRPKSVKFGLCEHCPAGG